MTNFARSFGRTLRACTITVPTSATALRTLIAARLTALGKTLPDDMEAVEVHLTPAAEISLEDSDWGDAAVTIYANTEAVFAAGDVLDRLELSASASTLCAALIYFV